MKINPWIAVTDSIPDADTTVLVYAPNGVEPVFPAYRECGYWVDFFDNEYDAAVTHWMHLPEPPEVSA